MVQRVEELKSAPSADVESLARFMGIFEGPIMKAIDIMDHTYWNTQFEWFDRFPDELARHFASSSDLTIVKGDANYRKLVGGRKYPVDEPFAPLVEYFPAKAVCALRGLKCELVVGVSQEIAKQQAAVNPDWKVDGSRGVIQFAKKA